MKAKAKRVRVGVPTVGVILQHKRKHMKKKIKVASWNFFTIRERKTHLMQLSRTTEKAQSIHELTSTNLRQFVEVFQHIFGACHEKNAPLCGKCVSQ